MRAVTYTREGETLTDVATPVAGEGEVLVNVAYCGICGSDLHAAEPDFHPDIVMGHEFSGIVAAVGVGVSAFTPGDRVTVNPNSGWCGQCSFCRAGEVTQCPEIWDHAVGLASDGGLAPLTSLPQRFLRRLPDSVSLMAGAWVEPLAVALRTVHRSGISVGDRAIVFGAGPIGLLVTSLLRVAGVSEVIVVERAKARRDQAQALGADRVVDPVDENLDMLFRAPVDAPRFAFECTGAAPVVAEAVRILRPHGRLMMTGLSRTPPFFEAHDVIFKEITVMGSFIYVDEFEQAIDLLAAGAVDVEPLTSAVEPLENASEVFRRMREDPEVTKILIQPVRGVK